MRFIKLGLISVFIFSLLFTLMSLLIPSQVRISKTINIEASMQTVVSLITDSSRWKEWHPLMQNESQRKNVMIAMLNKNDSLISARLTNADGKSLIHIWQLHQYEHGDSLLIQSSMEFNLEWYPWKKLGSILYDKTYGSIIEQGLNQMKKIAEQ